MASEAIKMKNTAPKFPVSELIGILRKDIDAELAGKSYRRFQSAEVALLTFERYYFRIGGYAALTILIVEEDSIQTVDLLGSGGGEGIGNISFGANKSFANMAVKILQSHGFDMDV